MYTRVLGLAISALILAYGIVGANAQDRMTPQPDQQQMQSHPTGQEGASPMGQGGMMGHGMMGGHMMGRGMMGGSAMGPSHCRSFRQLTNGFSRQWTAIKMAG